MSMSMPSTVSTAADLQAELRMGRRLDMAELLSALIIPLTALAAVAGLVAPQIYGRNPVGLIPVLRGQDLVTLLALPALVAALRAAGRGSARGTLVWIGLLGYLWYTYAGAALGYAFGPFTLVYAALFGLLSFALVAALSGVNAGELSAHFSVDTPRRPAAYFLLLVGLLLAGLEVSQNIQYLLSGAVPAGVALAGGGSYFVYGLDLGIVLPLTVLAAAWLWRGAAWGGLLAGCILIKGTAMGLALLAMSWFLARAGGPVDAPELLGFYAFLAAGGLAMSVWLLRHCR